MNARAHKRGARRRRRDTILPPSLLSAGFVLISFDRRALPATGLSTNGRMRQPPPSPLLVSSRMHVRHDTQYRGGGDADGVRHRRVDRATIAGRNALTALASSERSHVYIADEDDNESKEDHGSTAVYMFEEGGSKEEDDKRRPVMTEEVSSVTYIADDDESKEDHGSTAVYISEEDGSEKEDSKRRPIVPEEELSSDTYFEIDEECVGDHCHLPDPASPSLIDPSVASLDHYEADAFVENLIKLVPAISPLLAFFTYERVAEMFDAVLEMLSDRNWVAVDGGAYQTQIITPAINGIVVPSIAILFATLIANTVTTLRQRQLDVRTTLNMEAGEIRVLQAMVESFPQEPANGSGGGAADAQDKCRSYLIQYTTRLIAESQQGVQINKLEYAGSMDSEMNGFLSQLNDMSKRQHEDPTASFAIPPSLLSESYGAVTRLNAERSTRIAALQQTFPMLHYLILAALAGSICTTFLIEANQELLIFLTAIQLRLLWTMLVGTFSALAVVCYDLGDPFRGSYQISRSVEQFYTIRDALRASHQMKKIQVDKIDSGEH